VLEAEFDSVAMTYERQHAASIRLSGEGPHYFAEYKIKDVATELRKQNLNPRCILDFGGGVGNSLGHLRNAFPEAEIVLLDPSQRSLELAEKRHRGQAKFVGFDGASIPFGNASFDLIFVACVFHHIPAGNHVSLLGEIRRVLSPNGRLFLFEHNPFNPLTRHAVRNCPFDENAILISSAEMRRRVVAAGFARVSTAYRVFFPRILSGLRGLEPYMTRVPLGAQYFVQAANG
jgi:ubiquinone/menaquinone biosynthesis C-methylase UbiE